MLFAKIETATSDEYHDLAALDLRDRRAGLIPIDPLVGLLAQRGASDIQGLALFVEIWNDKEMLDRSHPLWLVPTEDAHGLSLMLVERATAKSAVTNEAMLQTTNDSSQTNSSMTPEDAASGTRSAENVRFCFWHSGQYADSGYGEDYYTTQDRQRARGQRAIVKKGGTIIWSGYLGDGDPIPSGCTDYIPVDDIDGDYRLSLGSYGRIKDKSLFVYNRNGDTDYLCDNSYPEEMCTTQWYYFDKTVTALTLPNHVEPVYVSTVGLQSDDKYYEFNTYQAIAWSLYRSTWGIDDSHYIMMIVGGNACQTGGACYDPNSGWIWVPEARTERKFVLSHDFGHRVGYAYTDAWSYSATSNYSGKFRYHKPIDDEIRTIDIESGHMYFDAKYMETNCVPLSGHACELDWLRALWDFYTDGPSTDRPSTAGILEFIADSAPWYYTNAYQRLTLAADNYSSSDFYARWCDTTKFNVADH